MRKEKTAVRRARRSAGLISLAFVLTSWVPAAATTPASVASLPSPRNLVSAVSGTNTTYAFGGTDPATRYNSIIEFGSGSTRVSGAQLLEPVSGTTAIWDNRIRPFAGCPIGCAYIFGGFNNHHRLTDQITRYAPNPLTGDTSGPTPKSARLPFPLVVASSVWDGRYAYLFGGMTCDTVPDTDPNPYTGEPPAPGSTKQVNCRFISSILRYDPANDRIDSQQTQLPAAFPTSPGRERTAAAWIRHADGCEEGCAYIFGGRWAGGQILRYSPSEDGQQDAITTMPNSKVDRWDMSAVSDGRYIYLFGGQCCGYYGAKGFDDILRYDPVADSLIRLSDSLPGPRWGAGSACTPGHAFLFGGATSTSTVQADGPSPSYDYHSYNTLPTSTATYYQRPDGDTDLQLSGDILDYQIPTLAPIEILGLILSVTAGNSGDNLTLDLTLPCASLPNLSYLLYDVDVTDGTESFLTEVDSVSNQVVAATACQSRGYRVKLVDGQGNVRAVSNTAWGRGLDPPRNVGAMATVGAGITLRWDPPARCELPSGYRIYRGVSSDGPMALVGEVQGVGTYTDTKVSTGVTYYYRVSPIYRTLLARTIDEGPVSVSVST